jgi:hypothetical protein
LKTVEARVVKNTRRRHFPFTGLDVSRSRSRIETATLLDDIHHLLKLVGRQSSPSTPRRRLRPADIQFDPCYVRILGPSLARGAPGRSISSLSVVERGCRAVDERVAPGDAESPLVLEQYLRRRRGRCQLHPLVDCVADGRAASQCLKGDASRENEQWSCAPEIVHFATSVSECAPSHPLLVPFIWLFGREPHQTDLQEPALMFSLGIFTYKTLFAENSGDLDSSGPRTSRTALPALRVSN